MVHSVFQLLCLFPSCSHLLYQVLHRRIYFVLLLPGSKYHHFVLFLLSQVFQDLLLFPWIPELLFCLIICRILHNPLLLLCLFRVKFWIHQRSVIPVLLIWLQPNAQLQLNPLLPVPILSPALSIQSFLPHKYPGDLRKLIMPVLISLSQIHV